MTFSTAEEQAADGYEEQGCRFRGEEDIFDGGAVAGDIDKLNVESGIVKPCAGQDVSSIVPVVVITADDLNMRVGYPFRWIAVLFPRTLITPDFIYSATAEYSLTT